MASWREGNQLKMMPKIKSLRNEVHAVCSELDRLTVSHFFMAAIQKYLMQFLGNSPSAATPSCIDTVPVWRHVNHNYSYSNGLILQTVTSHDETKAVPLFVQTDVDCLWYNPWAAVWCFENRESCTEREKEKERNRRKSFFFTDPVKYFLQLFTSVAPEVKYSLTFSLHPVIRHHLNEAGAFNTGK